MTPRVTRRTGLAALLSVPLAGCSPSSALDLFVPDSSYRGEEGIEYGVHPRQRLDVFQPLESTAPRPWPLVVFFYGGSWTRGERAHYRFVGESLATHGIVAVVADYRLSPEVRYPEFLVDCAWAVRWAVNNAAGLGADPRRIYLMGHSAGAYNAAMLALDGRWLAAAGISVLHLAGWIGLAGPYDFLPITNPDAQVAFNWPKTAPDTQPIHHASRLAPRTLLLAPMEDDKVNPKRSTVGLAKRLKDSGASVEHKLVEGVSHMSIAAALAKPLTWYAPVLPEVLAFLK